MKEQEKKKEEVNRKEKKWKANYIIPELNVSIWT